MSTEPTASADPPREVDGLRVGEILERRLGEAYGAGGDERWRLILEAANDAFVGMDETGRVTHWNTRAAETFGWTSHEATGQLLSELIIPEEFREAHRRGLQRFLDTGRGRVLFQRLDLPALRRDGTRFDAEVTIWPHREGDEWRFNAFVRDVTARNRTRALMQLLQRVARTANETDDFEAAVSSALAGVCEVTGWPLGHAYVVDRDDPGRLIPTDLWNVAEGDFSEFQAVTARKSFPAGEGLPGRVLASGRPAWIADIERDDNFTRRHAMATLSLRAGFGFPILTGDRVVAVLEFYSREPEAPDEELLDVLGDVGTQLGRVHERAEDARQREWARARLEEANRQKDQFVSVVAHELRSPLHAISGFAAVLQEEELEGDERHEFVVKIDRHARRMQRLVRDLLTLSRLDVDKLRCEPRPVDVLEAIRQVIEDLDLESVTVEGEEGLRALVDPDHLVQILTNLLTNAVTHGRPPVEITTGRRDGQVLLTVCDHGPGIPSELRPRLFERFAVRDRSQGTGLGLAISRELTELNGGSLEYDPDGAVGACFVARLEGADGSA